MVRRAELLGRMGESVVIDATWSSAALRALADEGARSARCGLVALRCDVPAQVAENRVARRIAAGTDISMATVAIARQISKSFEPWPSAMVIGTGEPAAEALTHAVSLIDVGAARYAASALAANAERPTRDQPAVPDERA
jgi:predicted kinase